MARGGEQQTFTVADDDRLAEMIEAARDRLVVVAPALTEKVAQSLARRCPDESISVTVVVDDDPEVYRLGYGHPDSLELLRRATIENGLHLGRQPGIRIGMIVSDDRMIIFSPVPQLIEAGSKVETKPNAIMLGGEVVDRAVVAAGGSQNEAEIGELAIGPDEIGAMKTDLNSNPPQRFDVARAVRVFSSRAEFVELEIENLRLASRRVQLPPELMGVADQGLRARMTSGIRPPEEALGPFDMEVELEDGSLVARKVDQKWVNDQRGEIERRFTFVVPRHGRVILIQEKEAFEAALERFERNAERYKDAVVAALQVSMVDFKSKLVDEFLPRWRDNPPLRATRLNRSPSEEQIKECLEDLLDDVLEEGLSLQPINARALYKGITWASANDEQFVSSLADAMRRRGISKRDIASLFSEFDAAKAAEGDQEH